MDTIDVSNLNRQFLFRQVLLDCIHQLVLITFRDKDVGRMKAIVAAERVSSIVSECNVTAYVNFFASISMLIVFASATRRKYKKKTSNFIDNSLSLFAALIRLLRVVG